MINLHLSQEDLGMLVNTSRQSVNKKLMEWQRLGWISMHYGKILITNREALEQLYSED